MITVGDDEFPGKKGENLRRNLFTDYDKNTRPIIDYDQSVELH